MRNAAVVKTNLSDVELRALLETALKEVESSSTVKLIGVYPSTSEILYSSYEGEGAKYFRRAFTVKDDATITFDKPVEVVEETTYVPVTASVAARIAASPRKTRPIPDIFVMSAAEHAKKNSPPVEVEVKVSGTPHRAPDTWAMSAAEHARNAKNKK